MSLVTGFDAMVLDSVEILRRSLETNDLGDALQAAAEIVPFKVTGEEDLEQVRERSALVDRLILAFSRNTLDLARKLLSVVHQLIPSPGSISKSPGRTPQWIKDHQAWVGEVHDRRIGALRDCFPVLYLEHMKSCDYGCGKLQVFRQIVSAQSPQDASEEFCQAGIDFIEGLGSIKRTDSSGWKQFVGGLEALNRLQSFARSYFRHTLKCSEACGSWHVFTVIAKRETPLTASTLRAAFRVLTKVKLRQSGKQLTSQVKRCQGLQQLLPHASRIEPEEVRARLLGALFRQVSKHTLSRSTAVPFLSYQTPLFVSRLPSAEELGQKEFMCDEATLRKIIRHAEWRVKFMLKLLVALYKDGRQYHWEKACLHYGRREGDLVQCHSAIIPSVAYREQQGGEVLRCSQGYGFHALRFFHEINHTVNLPQAYNGFDSWIEGVTPRNGTKGLRNLTDPILNGVSGFDKLPKFGTNTPGRGCVRFVNSLLIALEAYLFKDGKRVNRDGHVSFDMSGVPETVEREYARIQMWVYQRLTFLVPTKIPGVGVRRVRMLLPAFMNHCAAEDLGAEYKFQSRAQLLADWQKQLLQT